MSQKHETISDLIEEITGIRIIPYSCTVPGCQSVAGRDEIFCPEHKSLLTEYTTKTLHKHYIAAITPRESANDQISHWKQYKQVVRGAIQEIRIAVARQAAARQAEQQPLNSHVHVFHDLNNQCAFCDATGAVKHYYRVGLNENGEKILRIIFTACAKCANHIKQK